MSFVEIEANAQVEFLKNSHSGTIVQMRATIAQLSAGFVREYVLACTILKFSKPTCPACYMQEQKGPAA